MPLEENVQPTALCPNGGSALWCDLHSDAERAAFLRSGRGVETGVVAPAIAADLVTAYESLAHVREIARWAYNMGHTPQWMSREQHRSLVSEPNT